MPHPDPSPVRFLAAALAALALASVGLAQQLAPPKERPNVLMIVADDMNWDTPGCFGGAAPDVTPHLDQLASEGMRFWHAYVNISICTPSRSVLLTGLYPNQNGAEGFQRINSDVETLPAALNKAGFLCGIIGKPLRQQELLRWSVTYRWQGTGDENLWGRDPAIYRQFAKDFFAMAGSSQQPFFLMVNSHDPHRPFAGGEGTEPFQERAPASRSFQSHEVSVPDFLPDLAGVREELADYCTSSRRLDDLAGAVLIELEAAEMKENTIVVFLSDHGMPFPGAKFNCYPDSVRTPLIVRWPGVVAKNSIDQKHVISAIDLMPTLLEALGLPPVPSNGRSFLPLLKGQPQSNRDHVFAQFYHIHGKDALPMRSIITREHAYVFNPWSNGKRRFQRLGGSSFEAMETAAKTDPEISERIQYLRYRAVEEFFDLKNDPGCLVNLLNPEESSMEGSHSKMLDELRSTLRSWMIETKDPALHAFDNRNEADILEAFVLNYRNKAAADKEALKPYEKANDFRF